MVDGRCSGGITIGDLDRLREDAARERLCDRPRILEVMAPKKDSSDGEVVGESMPCEKAERGEWMSGDEVTEK